MAKPSMACCSSTPFYTCLSPRALYLLLSQRMPPWLVGCHMCGGLGRQKASLSFRRQSITFWPHDPRLLLRFWAFWICHTLVIGTSASQHPFWTNFPPPEWVIEHMGWITIKNIIVNNFMWKGECWSKYDENLLCKAVGLLRAPHHTVHIFDISKPSGKKIFTMMMIFVMMTFDLHLFT